MNSIKLYEGNCLDVLRKCPDNYMDSIVCDPPYGLSFMSRTWDYSVPSTEIWKECLRVLKPGGHLLAFGGTRTYHRLVVNIEDAGFEIRDQIMWIYGSGFPKSMDISKAIDKEAGATREVIGVNQNVAKSARSKMEGGDYGGFTTVNADITAPATEDAKRWSGYGTALKPANEPICLARKPLSEKTVAKNVLKHGVGGLNVDASRIPTNGEKLTGGSSNGSQTASEGWDRPWKHDPAAVAAKSEKRKLAEIHAENLGRFPANILFDEFAAGVLDEQTGQPTSRFFYIPKVSTKERAGSTHPTMKPVALMQYLIKLVTPEGGTVLDPFMGSGTTGVAAQNLGFSFRGIEMDPEYFKIAQARILGAAQETA